MLSGNSMLFAMENLGADRRARPTKLFIGGITRNTTTKTLRDHFSCYGSVLDCVAMRLPDGKPRGFGYVTLDSSAAADSVLAVPQVIDGRVVDMKRAVPESPSAASTPTASAKPTTDLLGLGLGEPMRIPQSAYNPWVEPRHVQFPVHQTTSMFGTAPMRAHTGNGTTSTPVIVGQGALTPTAPGMLLSACAPEFIPTAPAGLTTPTARPTEPASIASTLAIEETLERPFRQLHDITNVLNNKGDFKGQPALKKPTADGGLSNMYKAPSAPAGLVLQEISSRKMTPSALEIREDSSAEDEAADNVCDNDSDGSTDQPRLQETQQDATPLPSLGSAEHAAGTCKRCNFFSKGRCQHGQSCTFCHFPHEKRKLSRQEKRDRRAAWSSEYGGEYADDSAGSESGDSETNVQKIMAYSVLPGLPPIRATALPGPLSLPGSHMQLAKGYASVTPSLPPGLDVWQPDEEISPACVMSYNATPVSTPHSVGPLSSPHGAGVFLSTVPWAQSAPQSLAPSPTNSTAPTSMLNEKPSEPVPAAVRLAPKPAPIAPVAPSLAVESVKETCTIGTQTDEIPDKVCSQCRAVELEGAANKRMAAQGGA